MLAIENADYTKILLSVAEALTLMTLHLLKGSAGWHTRVSSQRLSASQPCSTEQSASHLLPGPWCPLNWHSTPTRTDL